MDVEYCVLVFLGDDVFFDVKEHHVRGADVIEHLFGGEEDCHVAFSSLEDLVYLQGVVHVHHWRTLRRLCGEACGDVDYLVLRRKYGGEYFLDRVPVSEDCFEVIWRLQCSAHQHY